MASGIINCPNSIGVKTVTEHISLVNLPKSMKDGSELIFFVDNERSLIDDFPQQLFDADCRYRISVKVTKINGITSLIQVCGLTSQSPDALKTLIGQWYIGSGSGEIIWLSNVL